MAVLRDVLHKKMLLTSKCDWEGHLEVQNEVCDKWTVICIYSMTRIN